MEFRVRGLRVWGLGSWGMDYHGYGIGARHEVTSIQQIGNFRAFRRGS